MELNKGYKQTEVGVIPEDWDLIELNAIGQFKNGINKNKGDFGFGYPFVNLMDVFSKSSINSSNDFELINSSKFERNLYNLNKGDVLFIRSSVKPSGVGLTSVVLDELKDTVFSGFLIRFRLEKEINDIFKKYCFFEENFRKRLISNSTVSANTNINQEKLKSLLLVLPSLEEQQAIAQVLSDTDELIQNLKALIAKKKAIKQGAMQELLTGKKRLQGFTGEWETKRLGDIAFINMGQSPLSEFYNDEGIGLPLIQGNADIKNRRTIIRSYTSHSPKQAKKGDVIMTVRAPVGEIAKASFDCCIGRGVCAINYLNSYLFYYLLFKENSWSKFSTGSTFDSINSNQLKGVSVYLPKDIQEQKAIAQILNDMDGEIEALEQQLQKTQTLKQGMMQELLTGKTRLITFS